MKRSRTLVATLLTVTVTGCAGSAYSSGNAGRHTARHHLYYHRSHYRHSSYARSAGNGFGGVYGASNTFRRRSPPSRLLGPRSKTNGCISRGAYPDTACTPGAVFVGATARQVCRLGYSRSVRHVSSSTWRKTYTEYGIMHHVRGAYEVDHLVSLELGGSNSIANLWPMPAAPVPGFHEKDTVENYLHDRVCSGAMSLARAQRLIAFSWVTVYRSISH